MVASLPPAASLLAVPAAVGWLVVACKSAGDHLPLPMRRFYPSLKSVPLKQAIPTHAKAVCYITDVNSCMSSLYSEQDSLGAQAYLVRTAIYQTALQEPEQRGAQLIQLMDGVVGQAAHDGQQRSHAHGQSSPQLHYRQPTTTPLHPQASSAISTSQWPNV